MKRIAIMGCSGRIHGVARRLTEAHPELKIVALFDPAEESLNRLQVTFPDAKAYTDQDDMFGNENFDWVLVGSLNAAHCDNICAAMQHGKDVFSEKPLAVNIEQLKRIQDAMSASGKKLVVGFNLRYSPLYRELKSLIANGAIGEILSFEFNETTHPNHGASMLGGWRGCKAQSGPLLLEKCTHDVDIMQWVTGSLPRKIASFGGLDFFVPKNAYHQQRLGKNENDVNFYYVGKHFDDSKGIEQPGSPFMNGKDIIDNQVAIMELYNGAKGVFHFNAHAGLVERRIYMVGTEGALRTDMATGKIELQRNGWDEPGWVCQVYPDGSELGHGGGDEIMVNEVAGIILHDDEIKTKYIDGVKSAVTCLMMDQAMENGSILELDNCWEALKIDPLQKPAVAAFSPDYFKTSKYDYYQVETSGHPHWKGTDVSKTARLEH